MKDSIIVGSIIRLFYIISDYCKKSFLYSVIEKIGMGFNRILNKSLIVGFFSEKDLNDLKAQNSFIGRSFGAISRFFARLNMRVGRMKTALASSVYIGTFAKIATDFKYISIRKHGLMLLIISLCFNISVYLRGMENVFFIAGLVLSAVSAVLVLIGRSPMKLINASFINRLWTNIFDAPIVEEDGKKKDTLCVKNLLIFSITVGVLALAFNPVVVLGLFVAGFGLFVFTMFPFAGVLTTVFLAPFIPTMVVVGLVMASVFTLIIHCIFVNPISFKIESMGIFVLLFTFMILLSSIFSVTPKDSIMAGLVWIAFLGYFIVMYNIVKDKCQLQKLLHVSVLSGVLVSLLGILQYFFSDSMVSSWVDTEMFEDILMRVYGTFGNPNTLGQYLVLALPISVGMFFTQKNVVSKIYYLIATGIMGLTLIFTYSRGCWISFALSLLVMIIFIRPKMIWLFLAAAILSLFVLPDSIMNRLMSIGNLNDSSTSFRVFVWIGTIELLKTFWFCGVGLGIGSYADIYPYFAYPGVLVNHAHNLYLQLATDFGITGIIICVMLFGSYFRNGFSAFKKTKNKRNKIMIIALISAIIGFLAEGLFDYVFYNYKVFFIFVVMIAIVALYKKFVNEELETEVCEEDKIYEIR